MVRYRLPAPQAAGAESATGRMKAFLAGTWPGRILAGALLVFVLGLAGVPLPLFVVVVDRFLLLLLGTFFLIRFSRFLLRTFLWRIRRKLILSYLFIAVVPLVRTGAPVYRPPAQQHERHAGAFLVAVRAQEIRGQADPGRVHAAAG